MTQLSEAAPSFVEMAHRIVWCSVATVDRAGRPRTRILHPIWEWDGERLVGWVGTSPTRVKRGHLGRAPFASCSYWLPSHDFAIAECRAELVFDDDVRTRVWNLFKAAPPPLGYDPGALKVPGWETPTSPGFVAMRLEPWRLRLLPGESFLKGGSAGAIVWAEDGQPG
jgi:hypothetical protein